MVLLSCAVCLVATAFVFRQELMYSAAIPRLGVRMASETHMNMINAKGDRDFYCLSKECDDRGGFQGRQTGYLYANRIDAVMGRPMRTNR